ncbi:hypothetical protein V8J88_06465 [Massilia sp. W12]|uniref:hypothetical protein n=1 Tax=Massilia sp. W12 TaxID=3126507 RepID=UPI0030CD7D2A
MSGAIDVLKQQARLGWKIEGGTFDELHDELRRIMPIKAEGFLSAARIWNFAAQRTAQGILGKR